MTHHPIHEEDPVIMITNIQETSWMGYALWVLTAPLWITVMIGIYLTASINRLLSWIVEHL